ncbi:MAG TPA: hypothetical protein VI356_24770 [Myxococcales bacterium]
MSAGTIVEVLIGLSFVYLLLSVICSAINEFIAGILALRQKSLRRGIEVMVGADIRDRIYDHPLIKSLYHGTQSRKLPAYIPSDLFAAALQDLVEPSRPDGGPKSDVSKALDALLAAIPVVEDQAVQERKAIGVWFDAAMASLAGAYKRQAQLIVAAVAVIVTATTNADTLAISRALWTQPQLRAAVANRAAEWVQEKAPAPGTPAAGFEQAWNDANLRLKTASTEVSALGLPIGWIRRPTADELPGKIAGLLFTMIAVSLGGPFWFDLLNKLVNLRAVGNAPAARAAPGGGTNGRT